jgi:AhpD family alkylhydroperoxidase
MSTRIAISATSPEGYRKVNGLDSYVTGSIEAELVNLVYLRASLLNGCTYCIDAHSVELESLGMPVRKIYSVRAWRESAWFSPRERAALALTEAITDIRGGVSDEVWSGAAAEFTEKELGDLVLAIGTINLWNRIAIPTRMSPPPLAPGTASRA